MGGQVYQQSIAAVCIQDWPKDRILVQVLDDSDELEVQQLINAEVQKWQQRGVRILYRHRLMRTGYKAGNLKSAMGCDYVKDYEFVAIFDADFQPGPDFLKKTIPHFKVIELNSNDTSLPLVDIAIFGLLLMVSEPDTEWCASGWVDCEIPHRLGRRTKYYL